MEVPDLNKEWEKYLKRPGVVDEIKADIEEEAKYLYHKTEDAVQQSIEKCDETTKKALQPFWNHPTMMSILNGIRLNGADYGETFQQRLEHPRIRELMEKVRDMVDKGVDPELSSIGEDWIYQILCTQEEGIEENKNKPIATSQQLAQIMAAGNTAKQSGSELYRRDKFEEAYKAYMGGISVMESMAPSEVDQSMYNKLLHSLWKGLSASSLEIGDLSTTLTMCDKLLKVDPYDTTSLFQRGMVYWRRGRYDVAESNWRKVIQLDPKDEDALSMLQRLKEDNLKQKEFMKKMFTKSSDPKTQSEDSTDKKAPHKIKVIVFSLYGTLVTIKNKVNPSPLLQLLSDLEVKDLKGNVDRILSTNFENINDIIYFLKPGFDGEPVDKFRSGLNQEVESVDLFPGTREALEILKSSGYQLYIVANCMSLYSGVIDNLGLRSYFHQILLSHVTGLNKPDPRLYQLVLSHSECKPQEVLWVGENEQSDYLQPKSMGIEGLLFQTRKTTTNNPSESPNGASLACLHLGLK